MPPNLPMIGSGYPLDLEKDHGLTQLNGTKGHKEKKVRKYH